MANSSLYKMASSGKVLCGDKINIRGIDIPVFLIGDSAYPLKTWLMKPFPHDSKLTHNQQVFNYHFSEARVVVENAFGRLKARWRRLSKRNDMNIDNIPCVVTACCILHNVCEVHGDTFNEAWLDPTVENSTSSQPTSYPLVTTASYDAKAIRDKLVEYYT